MAIGQLTAALVRDPVVIPLALLTLLLIPQMAAPMVVGAYLGKLLSPVRMTTPPAAVVPSVRPANTSRLVMLFAAGLLVCAVPVFFVSSGLVTLWIGVAAALGVASVAWAGSEPVHATGIAVGVVIAALMIVVAYDAMTGGPSHNMLPFDWWYLTIAAGPPAFLLALLTRWVVGRMSSESLDP
jgi:hypothetical protein